MLKHYFQYPFNNCQIFCIKVSSWWSASRNDFFDFELLPKGMLSSKKNPACGRLLILLTQFFQELLSNCKIFSMNVSSGCGASRNDSLCLFCRGIETFNRQWSKGKKFCLMLPFCWGRVYGLVKKHPGKVYHFVQVYLPLNASLG